METIVARVLAALFVGFLHGFIEISLEDLWWLRSSVCSVVAV